MTRKTLPAPSEIKRRAAAWAHVAQAIIDGLNGQPFTWGEGEWHAYSFKAQSMGFTLISQTGARRRGYVPREKAQPIGRAYFGSRRTGQVYILECHFKPLPPAETGRAGTESMDLSVVPNAKETNA